MYLRNSLSGPQWTSPKYIGSSPVENSNDPLVIEDLDLADLDVSPSSGGTSSSNEASPDEYVFCKENDDDKLFGEQIPVVVSETYLMDDLYILVKVPTNNYSKKQITTSTTASQTTPKSFRSSPVVKSNRMIYPIEEEEEEYSIEKPASKIPVRNRLMGKNLCWTNDTDALEEFVSTTNIIHDFGTLPNQVPELPQEPLFEVNHNRRQGSASSTCQKQIELQEVNLNSACFKARANVCLENYGILITPKKATRTENLLVFQVDTESKEKGRANRSSCFEWFAKIFRRKRRSTGFVHAKVYKTYFVKWKKCSTESDECSTCQCRIDPRRNSAQF